MKIIRAFLKAAFYPSLLSLVMFLMAVAVFVTSLMQVSVPFNAAQERTLVLNRLQNEVSYALTSMQIQEAYEVYVLLYGYEEDDFIEYAENANASIDQEFANLAAQGHIGSKFPYTTDLTAKMQAFNDTRAAHRITFNEVVSTIKSGGTDAASIMDRLENDNAALNSQLSDMIVSAEQDRLEALQDFPENINGRITFAVFGLALCLVLALLGYQVIATTVRPLRGLRNMITAIGGDQYRPEMQTALLKSGGPSGNLAKALDKLARAEQERTAGIKLETERLRQELYESRRRRLKVFHHPAGPEAGQE